MSYRFDEPGWYQFERLAQALLKADLGLAVESWGGHSDLGRDAYCELPLTYPSAQTLSPGPFLFQAKITCTLGGNRYGVSRSMGINSTAIWLSLR